MYLNNMFAVRQKTTDCFVLNAFLIFKSPGTPPSPRDAA